MAWQKGQSGNPKGRSIDKPWRDALRKAMAARDPETKRQYIDLVAESTRKQALAGDMTAAKEIGDRLDGKAPPSPEESEDIRNMVVNLVRFGQSNG